MSVYHAHDKFFRESFGRPEIARNYLEEYLPAILLPHLDLSQMNLLDGSFIDEDLKVHQSDLLYEVGLKKGGQAIVYFLFEHKSFLDEKVAFQLLRYMIRLWERLLKEGLPLAPILPLVLYHGDKAWNVSTQFADLLNAPEEMRPFIPHFHYLLADFSYLSEVEIKGEIWLRVALSVMRSIHDPDLRHQLPRLIDIVFALANQKSGVEYIRTILYYLTRATGKISRAQLEQVLLVQRELGEKTMMTIADEYIQEGIEKGIERGIARGIERGLEQGLEQGAMLAATSIARRLLKFHDIVTVSELTRLPLAEVQALAAEPEDPEETKPPTPHLN